MKKKPKRSRSRVVELTTLSIDDLVDMMRGTEMLLFADDGKTQVRIQMNKGDLPHDRDDAIFQIETVWDCQNALEGDDNE